MFRKTFDELAEVARQGGSSNPYSRYDPYNHERGAHGVEVPISRNLMAGAYAGRHKGKSGPIVFVKTRDARGVVIMVEGKEITIPMKNMGVLNPRGTYVEDVARDSTGRALAVGDLVSFPTSSSVRTYTLGFGHITSFTDSGNPTVQIKFKDGRALTSDQRRYSQEVIYSTDRVVKLPLEEDEVVAWVLNDFAATDI